MATNNVNDVVELVHGDGARAKVHLFGATIISWIYNDEERIFLSHRSLFDNKKAIRGGIPLVFPCFGPWKDGPQHGFARIQRWTLQQNGKNEHGDVVAVFILEDNEESRKMWDHRFKLTYTVTLKTKSIEASFHVNNTGASDFEFTCLMHTYLKVPDVSNAAVTGLQGLKYVDKVNDGAMSTENRTNVTIAQQVDRIYIKTPHKHDILRTMNGDTLTIEKHNLPDTVLWNPWAEKAAAMSDFGNLEYPIMLCVEAGRVVNPVKLAAGREFCSSQIITVKN